MSKVTVATVWLDGCSGCHMSFLDLDEAILELAQLIDIIYSPLVDRKDFPEHVDVAIVEGAVSTDEDEHKIKMIREHSSYLISLGDCAVSGNVPTMRNPYPVDDLLAYTYEGGGIASVNSQKPGEDIPHLKKKVRPLHEYVDVDVFIQGCPPPPGAIHFAVAELLAGRIPDMTLKTHPGA